MLEYILELHTSQITQMQDAQRFGLLGNGDRLGEGSNHHLSYHLCDLVSHSEFLPVTWLWVPWPKGTTCATACYSCRLFSLKKQDRKRGWLDKVKGNIPSGQDDCKRKLLTHSSILSASQNHPPSTTPLPFSLKILTLFSPHILEKPHYHLGQNTNAVVTEEKTKGKNIGSNSRYNFSPNSLFPKDREKSLSKLSSQDWVFKAAHTLLNTSKK